LEIYENRVVNGLLKAGTVDEPETASQLLSRDIEIIANPDRAAEGDLWPAVWALAAVLERQFSGQIDIRAGLSGPLRQPAQLSSRCQFGTAARSPNAIRIYLGCPALSPYLALHGDARGGEISYGSLLSSSERATAVDCFALAGYLGFGALALAAGIPAYREEFAVPRITLQRGAREFGSLPEDGLQFIGLGHLGQAYLALLFFLASDGQDLPRIQLLDKDRFESPNWSTQILIEPDKEWIGIAKAEYLRHRAESWGWDAKSEVTEINWDWHRPEGHSKFAVMGVDRFDVRRMAISAGYSWIFDAGLGDSFLRPRISWHSIPGDKALAKVVFPELNAAPPTRESATSFIDKLRNTEGGCGFLIYEQVQASAPCLGLVASAFLWSEISCFLNGSRDQIQASATIWSPILPPMRTVLRDGPQTRD
jgi:hypothetical protein